MGNFVHHVSGGIVVGALCSTVSYLEFRVSSVDAVAFGIIAGVGSLLPDIDSPHSKPNDMAFGLASVIIPVIVAQSFNFTSPSKTLLTVILMYGLVRYGLRRLLREVCVHRGIIHSIPVAIIWSCFIYWGFHHSPMVIKNVSAASALLGFVTHLIIDEMFSFINFEGVRLSPKQSFGSALKFTAPSLISTTIALVMALVCLYFCARDMRLI